MREGDNFGDLVHHCVCLLASTLLLLLPSCFSATCLRLACGFARPAVCPLPRRAAFATPLLSRGHLLFV